MNLKNIYLIEKVFILIIQQKLIYYNEVTLHNYFQMYKIFKMQEPKKRKSHDNKYFKNLNIFQFIIVSRQQ